MVSNVFLNVHPWEMIQFDDHVFQMGWNHQLDQVKSPNLFVPSNLQLQYHHEK